jgi:hypothetical protein
VPEPFLVGVEQPVAEFHQRVQVIDRADGARRVDAPQEQRLRQVDGPEAGQVALVEQRLADGPGGGFGEECHRRRRVPVRSEQVGPEVPDGLPFPRGRQHLGDAELVPGGQPLGVAEQQSQPVALPVSAGRVDPPRALHLEVRVHAKPAVGANEQVLAAGQGLGDRVADEADGRVARHAEIATGQYLPGEGRVQPLRGVPDDVTLGHVLSLPEGEA